MPIDYKKTEKDLYQPKTTPSIINVPEMTFITVDGKGDPNTSAEYTAAVELLYGFSYTIKMGNKSILEYVVPPLEGFWSVDDDFGGGGAVISDKSKFVWTMVIRQPDFVTADIFEASKAALAKKKPSIDTSKAKFKTITEGLCVQVMHIGSYDDEPATVAALDGFAIENGYIIDIDDTRRHHEIYISDPRKVAPEKLKTVLRHPIRSA
ncbi:transcriptional regulator [Desulfosporosinus fructosivorans]|uniref:Transcriptional regulator n=1 Tax=Desulfosporosinus fructosivorans TaxID=2018669 RepID=A0A4Z0R5G4_9FIRM|nr:GyrI-like domain-containing protein [Desulfosporosinus fructosivorans]TGE37393.1 transcriptional regulator [Desulfosporosinus fructosivorans]